MKAGLYIIATPIGNLGDITIRAIEALKDCQVIACEDTRVSRKLLSAYGIKTPTISYHDHNADQIRPLILDKIKDGQSVALISDAGTPLISDPGYKLVRTCIDAELPVTFLPGPSSVLAGLVLSGMPSDRFLFAGFADKKNFAELSPLNLTLVFFESAKRLGATLKDMAQSLPHRDCAIVREITKLYEEVRRGTFEELIQYYSDNGPPKGEVVVVLGPPHIPDTPLEDIDQLLQKALETHSIRDACTLIAGTLGMPRKKIYQPALSLKGKDIDKET